MRQCESGTLELRFSNIPDCINGQTLEVKKSMHTLHLLLQIFQNLCHGHTKTYTMVTWKPIPWSHKNLYHGHTKTYHGHAKTYTMVSPKFMLWSQQNVYHGPKLIPWSHQNLYHSHTKTYTIYLLKLDHTCTVIYRLTYTYMYMSINTTLFVLVVLHVFWYNFTCFHVFVY